MKPNNRLAIFVDPFNRTSNHLFNWELIVRNRVRNDHRRRDHSNFDGRLLQFSHRLAAPLLDLSQRIVDRIQQFVIDRWRRLTAGRVGFQCRLAAGQHGS